MRAATLSEMPFPDRFKIKKQRFVVMQIIGPEGCEQKAKELAIRVCGCYKTKEEADEVSLKIRNDNDFFSSYVAPMYEWLPLPPIVDAIEDVRGTDERVNSIRQSYIDHIRGDKREMLERLEVLAQQKAYLASREATQQLES